MLLRPVAHNTLSVKVACLSGHGGTHPPTYVLYSYGCVQNAFLHHPSYPRAQGYTFIILDGTGRLHVCSVPMWEVGWVVVITSTDILPKKVGTQVGR